MAFIWIVLIGAAAGFLGGKLMKPNENGAFIDPIAGAGGACVLALLVRVVSGGVGVFASVIVALIGASILLVSARRFMKQAPVPTPRVRRRY